MEKSNKYIIKHTTVGEIFLIYGGWIFWYCLMIINYFINSYYLNFANNITKPFPDELFNEIYPIVLSKLQYNNIIIQYSIILFTILFFSKKNLTKKFGHVSFEHLFGIIYIYSGVINFTWKKPIENNDYQYPYSLILVIFTLSEIFNAMLLFIIITPILLSIVVLCTFNIEKIFKKISKIQIKYSEERPIQIEKVV